MRKDLLSLRTVCQVLHLINVDRLLKALGNHETSHAEISFSGGGGRGIGINYCKDTVFPYMHRRKLAVLSNPDKNSRGDTQRDPANGYPCSNPLQGVRLVDLTVIGN